MKKFVIVNDLLNSLFVNISLIPHEEKLVYVSFIVNLSYDCTD